MNKLLSLMFVFIIASSILSQVVYMFEDASLFWKEISEDAVLPKDVNIVYSQGGQWWVEDNTPNWQEIIKKVKLVKINDLPEEPLQFVNSSPIIFKGVSGKYYIYLSQGKGWYEFVWNGKNGKILHVNGDMKILFSCDGFWKAVYTFKDERELGMSVKLKSSCIDEGDVYIISGKMFNNLREVDRKNVYSSKAISYITSSPDVSQFYEKYVFHIGNIKGMIHGAGIGVFDTMVNEVEKKYELSFSIERSTPYQTSQYVIYIKNDPYNGLGFYIPDGEVLVFKSAEEGEVPIGSFKLRGSPKGDYVKIYENKSKDVTGRIIILQSKKISKDRYQRNIKISLKNLKDDNVNARIILNGRDMNLQSSDKDPTFKSSEEIIFDIDLPSGESSFNLVIESSW